MLRLVARSRHRLLAGQAAAFGYRIAAAIAKAPTAYKPDYTRIARLLGARGGGPGCVPQGVDELVVLGGDFDCEAGGWRRVVAQVHGRRSEHGWDGTLKLANLRSPLHTTEQRAAAKGGAAVHIIRGADVLERVVEQEK